MRRKPYSVILFDEIEKAHPDVFNVLLQILDDGRVTDTQGRTVNFKNTIIIMTSNIGAQHLLEGIDRQGRLNEQAVAAVQRELRAHFRPEFLNRVDDVVLFKPLSSTEVEKIVDLLIGELQRRLEGRQIKVDLSDDARHFVATEAYDPIYGARPLKRFLQRELETQIGRQLIAGKISDGSHVKIGVKDGHLAVT